MPKPVKHNRAGEGFSANKPGADHAAHGTKPDQHKPHGSDRKHGDFGAAVAEKPDLAPPNWFDKALGDFLRTKPWEAATAKGAGAHCDHHRHGPHGGQHGTGNEVGTVTSDVLQANFVKQWASNTALTGGGRWQINTQSASQNNALIAEGDASYELTVRGKFKGCISDIDVGLITGDVVQLNASAQWAGNLAKRGAAGSQANGQAVEQTNVVVAQGNVDLDIVVCGAFTGRIRDVDVGLITGDVFQANFAAQAAGNLLAGSGGGGSQATSQAAEQGNFLAAVGDLDVNMVFNGNFRGTIEDLDIGFITGDVVQFNASGQAASNVARSGGAASQAVGQGSQQANYLVAVGDVEITLLFEGDFCADFRDVSIGLATGDISQTNTAIQVGMNLSKGGQAVEQSIAQFITQTNTIDADGELDIVLRFDPNYRGKFNNIDISLVVDNILQGNEAAQFASNLSRDAAWA